MVSALNKNSYIWTDYYTNTLNFIHMNYRLALCFFFLILIHASLPAHSNYHFEELNISNGLSHSKVNSICTDHKGNIWIATPYGLNRFDGDEIATFHHHEEDSLSLPSNKIFFALEDHSQRLWIGTDKGLCTYNRTDDKFEPALFQSRRLHITSVLADSTGVFLGGIGELFRYNYKSRQIVRLETKKDSLFYSSFYHIEKYGSQHLLLNTRWHGVYQYNLKTRHLSRLEYIPQGNHSALHVDSLNRIWISDYGKGLYCYSQGKQTAHFTTGNSPLNYDVIHTLAQKDNCLWMGTDGGGINILDLQTLEFRQPLTNANGYNSFPTDGIHCLYLDPLNNMWAGSIRMGAIYIYETDARSFSKASYYNEFNLSNKSLNCITEDSEGHVWIGTDGGGINLYIPASNTFRHFPNTYNEKITSIVEFSSTELLIHVFNKGLFLFNKNTGHTRPFSPPYPELSTNEGYTTVLHRLHDGHILFSALTINIYDKATRQCQLIATKGKDYQKNSPLVKEASNGKLYIIDTQKILEYNRRNNQIREVYQSQDPINDVCIDANNTIWIGTTSGISSYNTVTCEEIRIKPDLLHSIRTILNDREGHLWIGTSSNHLFVYDISTAQITMMGVADGFIPNEYIENVMLVSSQGDIFIGGSMGLTIVGHDYWFRQHEDYAVRLTDVILNGKSCNNQISQHRLHMTLPHNFTSISLKFNIDRENIFRKHVFKYTIRNKDKTVVANTLKRTVDLQYLPEGINQIMVSYITSAGEWSAPQFIGNITILPPWWKSQWFIAACILTIIIVYIGIIYYLYYRGEHKKERAIKETEERLSSEKIQFLINISHELRTPLTLITSPLKEMIGGSGLPPEISNKLNNIYRQALQIKHLVDLVLEVKKIEKGELLLNIALHPLNAWLKTDAEQCREELDRHGIQLRYELSDAIGKVPFDKEKCSFILNSFMVSAIRMGQNCHTLTIASTMTEKHRIRIEVRSDGQGTEDADITRLFSLYYQLKNNNGEDSVRLSYSKSLMDLHNGKIGVTKNIGKELTFYFEIPATPMKAQFNKEEISIEYPIRQIDFTPYSNCALLIISESKDFRNYLKVSLHKYFNHVYLAQNGKDGLSLTRSIMPDLIISDLIMTHTSGFKICQTIKEDKSTRHIPIVLLTAYNTNINQTTAYQLGADMLLPKPFSNETLFAIVHNLLATHKKTQKAVSSAPLKDKTAAAAPDLINNADQRFLQNLDNIILKHIDDIDLNVKLLTEEMGMSRTLLFNKIKKLKDMGISDYINSVRIEKASSLLKTSNMSISEISEKTGFASPKYFSRVFKQQTGSTPTEYRNKN